MEWTAVSANIRGTCLDESTENRWGFPQPDPRRVRSSCDLRFLLAPRDHRFRRAGHDFAHQEMSVKRNKWLTEETFKDGVVICQSVPGATAMQMAAYVGLRGEGVRGAVRVVCRVRIAGVSPDAALAYFIPFQADPLVDSLFQGLQVMVVAIVANAHVHLWADIKKYR